MVRRLALATSLLTLAIGGCVDQERREVSPPATPAEPAATISLPSDVPHSLDIQSALERPTSIADLRFDPEGRWAAEACGDEQVCIWQLGTGHYLGMFSTIHDSAALARLGDRGDWTPLRAIASDDEWATTSPDGTRRARLSSDLATLEIIDSKSTGRFALPLMTERGTIAAGFTVWGRDRVLVVLTRSLASDDEALVDSEAWSWSDAEGLAAFDVVDDETYAAWYLASDRSRLFGTTRHGSEVVEFEFGVRESGFDTRFDMDFDSMEVRGRLDGRWIAGAATAWITLDEVDGEEGAYHFVEWMATRVEPEFAHGGGLWLSRRPKRDSLRWTHAGYEDGHLVHEWTACWSPGNFDEDSWEDSRAEVLGDGCVGERPTGACRLLAAGPGGRELLAQCREGAWIGPPTTTLAADAQTFPGIITNFAWTRRGLIVETEDALWRSTPSSAALLDELPNARIVNARLSGPVGRVLIEGDRSLIVLDPATGGRLLKLPSVPVTDAAFSPDGEHLAIASEGWVMIHAFDSPEPPLRWYVSDVPVGGLAWRQDGAALMTGASPSAPDRLWSLEPRPRVLPVDFSDFGEDWQFDPGWRWAVNPDATFVRTLDFVELHRRLQAVHTSTGLFDGSAKELADLNVIFRERPDWGAYDFAELVELLHYPNLAAAFFAGEPLSAPATPEQPPNVSR